VDQFRSAAPDADLFLRTLKRQDWRFVAVCQCRRVGSSSRRRTWNERGRSASSRWNFAARWTCWWRPVPRTSGTSSTASITRSTLACCRQRTLSPSCMIICRRCTAFKRFSKRPATANNKWTIVYHFCLHSVTDILIYTDLPSFQRVCVITPCIGLLSGLYFSTAGVQFIKYASEAKIVAPLFRSSWNDDICCL